MAPLPLQSYSFSLSQTLETISTGLNVRFGRALNLPSLREFRREEKLCSCSLERKSFSLAFNNDINLSEQSPIQILLDFHFSSLIESSLSSLQLTLRFIAAADLEQVFNVIFQFPLSRSSNQNLISQFVHTQARHSDRKIHSFVCTVKLSTRIQFIICNIQKGPHHSN